MARILIAYSSIDGHTRKICRRLSDNLERRGHAVTEVSVTDPCPPDPLEFDRIVVGAAIRYGKHAPKLIDFVNRNAAALNARPGAFFSVSVSARKAANSDPQTNAYMRAFLRTVKWRPRHLAVFAGRIDYPSYGSFDRTMIRLIMLLTGGPTARNAVVEFTDWNEVEDFGSLVGAPEFGSRI